MNGLTKNQMLAMAKDAYIAKLLMNGLISVSGDGSVFNDNWRGKGIRKAIKQTLQKTGYLYVALPGRVTAHASRVVAIAFHGLPDGYREASHRNGIHTDNRPGNLVWRTPKENTNYSFDAGFNKPLCRVGEDNGRAVLTKKKVRAIRRQLANGVKPKEIASKTGVSRRAIYNIKNGDTWEGV